MLPSLTRNALREGLALAFAAEPWTATVIAGCVAQS